MVACGYLKWFSRDLVIPPSLFTIQQTFRLFSVQFLKNEDFLTRNEEVLDASKKCYCSRMLALTHRLRQSFDRILVQTCHVVDFVPRSCFGFGQF